MPYSHEIKERRDFRQISAVFLSVFIICSLQSRFLEAADVTLLQPISFGSIVVDPVGEIIEIDASAGPAAPRVYTSGHSYINGGNNGIIRVNSDMAGQIITVDYPPSVALHAAGSSDLSIDGIQVRSTPSTISGGAGPIDFYIGGLLHIGSGQPSKNFSGTMTITVTFTNP